MPPLIASSSTGLTITNPLILYRVLLATKQIDPDPAQHRLALHLQKLYFRLKDYSPQAEYGSQLKAISEAADNEKEKEAGSALAAIGHPLRRNPLFAHLFRQKDNASTLALTRLLASHEAAMSLDSPRGLLLHGEVGTGKSMLVDLLAHSLPTRKKRRWHFNTFMLETMSKLESLRLSRLASGHLATEYSLLVLAKEMIEQSPILFVDEFQLPDRASSKILSNLLITFFQLGGVLIASSNRMPDELAKASGIEYAPPPRTGLVRNWLGLGVNGGKGDIFAGNNEFSNFLDVLKARCDIWDIDGGRDWRRRDAETEVHHENTEGLRETKANGFEGIPKIILGSQGSSDEQSIPDFETVVKGKGKKWLDTGSPPPTMSAVAPKRYIISDIDSEDSWQAVVRAAFPSTTPHSIPWKSTTLTIYGRIVQVRHQHNGVTLWAFSELCGGAFGPADYISLSSTFHTLILTDIPILTLLQKNEARRLITLLDALYECRCKLIIRAATGPDTLFFPETSTLTAHPAILPTVTVLKESEAESRTLDDDAVYPETLSEIYQDRTSPFRPNVSSYSSTETDQDSDFGPGHEISRQAPDFAQTGAFTGEDERFAYKRASSRLWEMCGARWHARSEPGWWCPLPIEVRRWERSVSGTAPVPFDPLKKKIDVDVKLGASVRLKDVAGLSHETELKGLIQEKRVPPPKIGG